MTEKSRRTIAIDARSISSSTGTYVERLLAHLQEIDRLNDYVVLLRESDAGYWTPKYSNFSTQIAEFDNYSVAEQVGFKRFLENANFDLVHFCMPQQPVWYKGKTVTTFHDLTLLKTYNSDKNWAVFRLKQLVGRFVFRKVARDTNAIVVPSRFTEKELVAFSPPSSRKITLTYESAERVALDPEPMDLPFSTFLLYVGSQSDYKNIAKLAEAHQKLRKIYPELGLVLAGKLDDAAQRNRSRFERAGYESILFTGFVSDGQRDWLYQNTAVYVFPSLMEGFGLPGLEAMLSGAPVASSNATCLPEIYGDAAVYFDPTDANQIAQKIGMVLDSPQFASELVTRGHQQAASYSWRRMAEQTHVVYESVLAV